MKILLVGLVWIGLVGCSLFGERDSASPMQVGLGVAQNSAPVGEITKDVSIRQTFEALYDNLAGVSIYMATYGRQNSSTLTVSIVQADKEKVLKTYNIDSSKLLNNSWLLLPFEVVKESRNKAFWVDIQGNGESGNSPTVWMNTESTFAESRGKLFINAKESPGSLCFQLYYSVR